MHFLRYYIFFNRWKKKGPHPSLREKYNRLFMQILKKNFPNKRRFLATYFDVVQKIGFHRKLVWLKLFEYQQCWNYIYFLMVYNQQINNYRTFHTTIDISSWLGHLVRSCYYNRWYNQVLLRSILLVQLKIIN